MIHDLALLAARLVVGKGMAGHGAQKAFGWFEGPGPEGAAAFMQQLGFRPAEPFAKAAAWNELVGGELVAFGLGGPLGPALVLSQMAVAMLSVHAKNGFFAAKNGVELPALYAAAALALAATGYGRISLDGALGLQKRLHHPVLTTLALAGGIAAALAVHNVRAPAADGPATPTFRGKNSPLPDEQALTP